MSRARKIFKEIRGIFLFILTVLTAVIFMMWLRSFSVCDVISVSRQPKYDLWLKSQVGKIDIRIRMRSKPPHANERLKPPIEWKTEPISSTGSTWFASFKKDRSGITTPYQLDWAVPYWLILIPISLPLLTVGTHRAMIHQKRWSRKNGNLCSHCGYDLRASPERCPECGLEVPLSRRHVAP